MEELISLFIPKGLFFEGAKLSKVALPCSKATKNKLLLLESEVCEVMLKVSVLREAGEPSIYIGT